MKLSLQEGVGWMLKFRKNSWELVSTAVVAEEEWPEGYLGMRLVLHLQHLQAKSKQKDVIQKKHVHLQLESMQGYHFLMTGNFSGSISSCYKQIGNRCCECCKSTLENLNAGQTAHIETIHTFSTSPKIRNNLNL